MDLQIQALETLSGLNAYNLWLVSKFKNFIKNDVLEIGSGIGTITSILISTGFNVTPSEINKKYIKKLKQFSKQPLFLDITKPCKINKKFQTIVAVNVVEHTRDDMKVLINISKLLKDKGILILLAPAHNFLYGSYDKRVGHFRRYSKKEISNKLVKTNFKIKKIFYINKLGALGWFVNSKLLKRKGLPQHQTWLINKLVPCLDFLDKTVPLNFGLSIIAIAQKKL
ncbi:methyltransferase domain-containing protein [Candidatus Daviesbacteria bacterium]|nr:methyltransferase domain-containing protein [Candidatus Daviesbacteria bacterium]